MGLLPLDGSVGSVKSGIVMKISSQFECGSPTQNMMNLQSKLNCFGMKIYANFFPKLMLALGNHHLMRQL